MSDLVTKLSTGSHKLEVILRPQRTATALKERIEQYGFVHLRFTETRGGTELGVTLEKDRCDLSSADFENGSGEITLVGHLKLDYIPVQCIANVDLKTLAGSGLLAANDRAGAEDSAASSAK
ncbi:MAG TPA: hypothetical protein VMF91_22435 [Bryobacteraceae bacterium]|nr:hypothetical protein [Bryobacteraceae bacterium]